MEKDARNIHFALDLMSDNDSISINHIWVMESRGGEASWEIQPSSDHPESSSLHLNFLMAISGIGYIHSHDKVKEGHQVTFVNPSPQTHTQSRLPSFIGKQ